MESKVAAAELAAGAGIATVIADGTRAGVVAEALADAPRGRASPRRRTPCPRSSSGSATASGSPAASTSTRARARRSSSGGASLLAVGVVRCEGAFKAGDGVELVGPDGAAFARGIASVDAAELAGRRPGLEAVHRDRLVLA